MKGFENGFEVLEESVGGGSGLGKACVRCFR